MRAAPPLPHRSAERCDVEKTADEQSANVDESADEQSPVDEASLRLAEDARELRDALTEWLNENPNAPQDERDRREAERAGWDVMMKRALRNAAVARGDQAAQDEDFDEEIALATEGARSTSNPVFAWRVIAYVLVARANGRRLELPDWCWDYLTRVAVKLSFELAPPKDRRDKSWPSASDVAAVLGLVRPRFNAYKVAERHRDDAQAANVANVLHEHGMPLRRARKAAFAGVIKDERTLLRRAPAYKGKRPKS